MNNFIANISSGDILAIFRSFGVFYQFTFQIEKTCRISDMNFEVIGFCLDKANNCSIEGIVDNLSKSIFKLTGAANRIIEVIVNQYTNMGSIDINNLDDAATTYTDLGRSIGSMLRGILGFTHRYPQNRRPKPTPRPTF
jgi:hypothetical protein